MAGRMRKVLAIPGVSLGDRGKCKVRGEFPHKKPGTRLVGPGQPCRFRAEKRSAQASAHPLSQAQGGLFRVLTVFVFCWSSE